jgi:hypothetical protein
MVTRFKGLVSRHRRRSDSEAEARLKFRSSTMDEKTRPRRGSCIYML